MEALVKDCLADKVYDFMFIDLQAFTGDPSLLTIVACLPYRTIKNQ